MLPPTYLEIPVNVRVLAALALSFAVLSATAAPTPAPAPTDASAPAAESTSQKTKCMRHKEIGSNKTKKVCMSAERWNSLSPEERDAVIRSDKGAAILD